MLARSASGVELLYQYQDFGEKFCRGTPTRSPPCQRIARAIVTDMCTALIRGNDVKPVANTVDLAAGRFEFHAEPLTAVGRGEAKGRRARCAIRTAGHRSRTP